MLKDLSRKGDFMVKIDLKDAYFTVPPNVSEVCLEANYVRVCLPTLWDIALQHASTALDLLHGLRFMINYVKSVLVPSTKMEFLGFVVDSITLSLALPREKIKNVRKECQTLLDSQLVTVRQLARLLGHLISTIQAVFPGPLHFRHLQNEKNRALENSQNVCGA